MALPRGSNLAALAASGAIGLVTAAGFTTGASAAVQDATGDANTTAMTVVDLSFLDVNLPPGPLPLLSTSAAGDDEENPGTMASATAGVVGGVDPSVAVSASGIGTTNEEVPGVETATAFASASLTYYFEIVGPTSPGPIDVLLTGSNQTSSTIDTGVSTVTTATGVEVYDSMGDPVANQGTNQVLTYDSMGNLISSVGPDSYSDPLSLTMGEVYKVELGASVNLTAGLNSTFGSASVDPMLITPLGYSIEYSANLTVPEPPTWILALAGFGLLALFAHRVSTRLSAT